MQQSIGQIALIVRDYDEAIHFYAHQLGFTLVEDTAIPAQNKRWVVIAPPGDGGGLRLLMARAVGEEQLSRAGNQTGGRVFLFLYTDDIWRDFNAYQTRGVVPGPVWQLVGPDSVSLAMKNGTLRCRFLQSGLSYQACLALRRRTMAPTSPKPANIKA